MSYLNGRRAALAGEDRAKWALIDSKCLVAESETGRTFFAMGSELRVLVAEDDEVQVVRYKMSLHRLGIKHHHIVRDGAELLDYLQGNGRYADRGTYPFPDWLLLDFKMPKVTGLEILEWLQSRPECQIVPIVMFSNSHQPADVTKAYRLGVNAFFTKPTQYEEMLRILGLVSTFWTVAQRPPLNPGTKC